MAERAPGGACAGPLSSAAKPGASVVSASESEVPIWLPLPSALSYEQNTPGNGVRFVLNTAVA